MSFFDTVFSIKLGEAIAALVGVGGFAAAAVKLILHGASKAKDETLRQLENRVKQPEPAEVRSVFLDDSLSRLRADFSGLEKKYSEITSENNKLRLDLDAALRSATSGGPSAEIMQVIGDYKRRLEKYDQLRDALMGQEDELWRFRGVKQPQDFEQRIKASRLKVVTIANLKGGVGKTTLTANLMACLSRKYGKRVLAIDLDYQGSLTRMVLLGANLPLGAGILADTMLDGKIAGDWLAQSAREIGAQLPGCRLITCGQIFDRFENRTLLQWLLGDTEDDVRFRLASLLLDERVQKEFDVVLIDAPPRMSMGAVNALCASHALIVPTVLDHLSVDAVGRFLGRTDHVFRPLNPALLYAGVVGTLTKAKARSKIEGEAFTQAKRALANWHGRSNVFATSVPHLASLSRAAGSEIGYIGRDKSDIAPVFDLLGEEIVETYAL